MGDGYNLYQDATWLAVSGSNNGLVSRYVIYYQGFHENVGISTSMDEQGRVYDNIFIEQLWRTVKYEEV